MAGINLAGIMDDTARVWTKMTKNTSGKILEQGLETAQFPTASTLGARSSTVPDFSNPSFLPHSGNSGSNPSFLPYSGNSETKFVPGTKTGAFLPPDLPASAAPASATTASADGQNWFQKNPIKTGAITATGGITAVTVGASVAQNMGKPANMPMPTAPEAAQYPIETQERLQYEYAKQQAIAADYADNGVIDNSHR
jgi:hypothetical protein